MSPSPPRLARRALRQALLLAVLLAALAVIGLAVSHQPDNQDEVKIVAGEWRSHSAELDLLYSQAGRLPPRFLKAHGKQLAEDIDASLDRLNQLHPEPALLGAVQQVSADALPTAQAVVHSSASPQAPSAADRRASAQRTERLVAVEEALKR